MAFDFDQILVHFAAPKWQVTVRALRTTWVALARRWGANPPYISVVNSVIKIWSLEFLLFF